MDFVLQKLNTVVTLTANLNVVAGDQFEFVAQDSLLDFGFSSNATGMTIDVFLTSRTVCRGLIPHLGTINVPPVVPDHYPLRKVEAFQHDRIVINVNNPTGGSIVLVWSVIFHT